RILIVEDEFLAALEMQGMIEQRGGSVAGPVGRLEQAMNIVGSETLDAGVLDVALDSLTSYPIADELARQGVPVIFVTGYAGGMLPDRLAAAPKLSKPVTRKALETALRAVLPALQQ